jgi:NADPH:quinone reductase-like Zn-dependent oxidoreductase
MKGVNREADHSERARRPEALAGRVADPTPVGEALVANAVSGVNFIDTYFRTGLYPSERLTTIGSEAAGVVERVGPGVTEVRPGDRVAYTMVRGPTRYAVVPAWRLVPLRTPSRSRRRLPSLQGDALPDAIDVPARFDARA